MSILYYGSFLFRTRLVPLTVKSMTSNRLIPGCLLLSLFCAGCVQQQHFRSDINDVPCEQNRLNVCNTSNLIANKDDGYTLGFVEIDDQGQFYERKQAESLLKILKKEQQPQYVTIFVHGWHHNAKEEDINVKRFKENLKETKLRNPTFKVTGIYVGWRGETISFPGLRLLSFWDRKLVSEEVGRNALSDFLLRVETAVNSKSPGQNRLLTIGHSLGASVIFNALHQVLLERMTQPDNDEPRLGFGDLVVLVNPALEAIRYTTLREATQRYHREHGFKDSQNPLLIIASSESDSTIKDTFSLVRTLSAAFEDHMSFAADEETAAPPPLALSEWELDTTSVGHVDQFITHRLEKSGDSEIAPSCDLNAGWLKNAVATRKKQQQQNGESPSGEGWLSSDAVSHNPVHQPPLQLKHLKKTSAYDPYWVIQIDKNIMPNHGFMNQKSFLCFIDQSLHETTPYPISAAAR